MRVADRDHQLAHAQLRRVAEQRGKEIVGFSAQHGEIGKRVRAHDAERDLAPVDERGTADAVAPGDHVRGGEQVAVRRENDAAATARRSPPAARGAQDAEVGHAGGQALGYA